MQLVQGIGDRPKDLPRQLEKEGFEEVTVYPQRGKAVIFDGRLLHQSLHHMGIAQRAALAFWLAPNESTKLNVNQEQYLHQRLHKTSDNWDEMLDGISWIRWEIGCSLMKNASAYNLFEDES